MNSLTCIIVDDEKNARLSLRGILQENFPEIKILAEAKDIPEAVKAIHQHQPKIVFLDIEMPGYSGLSILDFFDKEQVNFKIIFVTAYSEYAINAFELSAIDYILKPIRKEQLERAIQKVSKLQKQNLELLKENIQPETDKKIAIKSSEGTDIVKIKDIMYIKAASSYTEVFLNTGQKLFTTKKLKEFEKLEHIGLFLKIHRSHIININFINKINKNDKGTIIMSNGEELSLTADKKAELLKLIDVEYL